MRNAGKVLAPLTDDLKGPTSSFLWTPAMALVFSATKWCLVQVVALSHPNPWAPLSVGNDASAFHVGAALQQWVKGAWQFVSALWQRPYAVLGITHHQTTASIPRVMGWSRGSTAP